MAEHLVPSGQIDKSLGIDLMLNFNIMPPLYKVVGHLDLPLSVCTLSGRTRRVQRTKV